MIGIILSKKIELKQQDKPSVQGTWILLISLENALESPNDYSQIG